MVLSKIYVVILKDKNDSIERVLTFSEYEAANEYAATQRAVGSKAEVYMTSLDSRKKNSAEIVAFK